MQRSWNAAYSSRDDLAQYGDNALLMYALELHQGLEDVHTTAANAITDGSGDKKCDLVFVDREKQCAVLAQGYWTSKPRQEAPANKASDLNTATSWLLNHHSVALPKTLEAAAFELREAIKSGDIGTIHIWYVHNLPESDNVKRELDRVEQTGAALLRQNFGAIDVQVSALEVGNGTLERWYRGTLAPILVSDSFTLSTDGGFKTEGDGWMAYSTSVRASWLREMYVKYGRELFSANVRDYLGSRRSDRNINHNIKQTARDAPERFWVYNNGITALVNDIDFDSDGSTAILELSGIAIVNGAQTTGALGSVEATDIGDAHVPARFVKCADATIVQEIIRYNNSQNKIEAADFRSNDRIQTRLRTEFENLKNVEYLGGRRGGEVDRIRRTPNRIPSSTAGQALAAFHGQPDVAYNQKSGIWQSDTLYSRYFNERTSAGHIVLCYSLLEAIHEKRRNLLALDEDIRTNQQAAQAEFFRQRGSNFLLTSAMASAMEIVAGRPIADRFKLRFATETTLDSAIEAWIPVLNVLLPFAPKLKSALTGGNLKKKQAVEEAVVLFSQLADAIRGPNEATFQAFSGTLAFS